MDFQESEAQYKTLSRQAPAENLYHLYEKSPPVQEMKPAQASGETTPAGAP